MPDGATVVQRHRDGWRGGELDRGALYWDFTPAHLAAIDELMERVEPTLPRSEAFQSA